jgi:hypothetical protein
MSPKLSRPAREPDDDASEPLLPPGHVPLRPPPKPVTQRRPGTWWWGFGAFVVVATAAVVAIVYASQPHQDSPRGTADLVAGSLTDADLDAFTSYLCDGPVPGDWADMGATTVLAVSEERDGAALATLTPSRPRGVDLLLSLEDRDDSWCVVGADLCPRANDTLPNPPAPAPPRCQFRPGR